jgi:hypothetical protein
MTVPPHGIGHETVFVADGRGWEGAGEKRSERASRPVSEDRTGQRIQRRSGATAADRKNAKKRGGACPIGAPSRREGGWNPEVRSEMNARHTEFNDDDPSD